ncbi:uncharacterized protein LOC112465960 [Temnothorax curvispinosus]|uniref:Uncharacterized protein LOC112465960 n=1 Tax=Temnothorax curvispinosus TaxID=300111 RepID=A0A6J1R4L7_9HYME|nr:uncharacterized protein LOC112465960 [Temnothorax curvispinosus]
MVVAAMKEAGLRVAPQKTQIVFYGKRRGKPPPAHIEIEGTRVSVGAEMKVLGLWLDGTWSFGGHFARLTPKVKTTANSLARLMPNLGGGGERTCSPSIRDDRARRGTVWCPCLGASGEGLGPLADAAASDAADHCP